MRKENEYIRERANNPALPLFDPTSFREKLIICAALAYCAVGLFVMCVGLCTIIRWFNG